MIQLGQALKKKNIQEALNGIGNIQSVRQTKVQRTQ